MVKHGVIWTDKASRPERAGQRNQENTENGTKKNGQKYQPDNEGRK